MPTTTKFNISMPTAEQHAVARVLGLIDGTASASANPPANNAGG